MCNGVSANLSTIKYTMGVSGVFGRDSSLSDANSICPWFSNPFNPNRNIYWLICPSHQLKNMVNALYSSRADGKAISLDGIQLLVCTNGSVRGEVMEMLGWFQSCVKFMFCVTLGQNPISFQLRSCRKPSINSASLVFT